MHDKVFDSAKWQRLISPDRIERMNPQLFFDTIQPQQNESWADVGCGPGYFTLPFAGKVKKVFALDISNEMLEICRNRARENNISNIEFIQSDSIKIDLPDQSVDNLFLVNVYHEFPNVQPVIEQFSRILKSAGKVFVIDWRCIEMESGPPSNHRVPEKQVQKDFEKCCFSFAKNHNLYDQNYVLEFRKNK